MGKELNTSYSILVRKMTDSMQRPLFLGQVPFSILAGSGVFLSMPTIDSGNNTSKGMTLKQRLARIDYLGATLMVGFFPYPPNEIPELTSEYRPSPWSSSSTASQETSNPRPSSSPSSASSSSSSSNTASPPTPSSPSKSCPPAASSSPVSPNSA